MVRREPQCEARPFRLRPRPNPSPVLPGIPEATPQGQDSGSFQCPGPTHYLTTSNPSHSLRHSIPPDTSSPPSQSPSLLPGPDVYLVLTKGCTANEDHKPRITQHRLDPSFSIVSYTHVCRHRSFCNDLSSTHPLWVPPPVTGARGRWGHKSGRRGDRMKD